MRLGRWSRTASQNNDTPPDGAPENWAPSAVNNWGREIMARLREWYQGPEWLDLISENLGAWPSITKKVGSETTTIVVAGQNATALFTRNPTRRIKVYDSVNLETGYGHVLSATFSSPDTEIAITWDSGSSMPTAPDEAWLAPEEFGTAAFKDEGAGSGLDADTVDGIEAGALSANFGKNAIINGRFPIWQRGSSAFTISGAGEFFAADRWIVDGTAGSAGEVTRGNFTLGQTDVPAEPKHYLRVNVTTEGVAPVLMQRVEGVRTFAGQQVTLSAYVKADASRNVDVKFKQNFGTGGSPSSAVEHGTVTTWNLSTVWVRYTATVTLGSLVTKTMGTNGDDYLEIKIEMGNTTQTIDVADVQLELGASATAIDQRPISEEISRCQRYFAKTFDLADKPAQNVGNLNGVILSGGSGSAQGAAWRFPVRMRAIPSITTYQPNGASTGWEAAPWAGSTTPTAIETDAGETAALLSMTTGTDGIEYVIHATAEAEL